MEITQELLKEIYIQIRNFAEVEYEMGVPDCVEIMSEGKIKLYWGWPENDYRDIGEPSNEELNSSEERLEIIKIKKKEMREYNEKKRAEAALEQQRSIYLKLKKQFEQ